MAAIDRTPYNALVDDDGSNLVGTPWTKNIVKTVLLDPIDVALATKIDTGGSPVFGGGITIGTVPITGPGGVLVVGGPITCNPYLAVGVNPAQAGTIRIPNNAGLYSRNQANDGDLPILYYDTSNRLVLGYAGTPLIPYSINQDLGLAPGGAVTWRQGFFSSGVGIGGIPAQGGALRLTNTQYINSRNGANNADIALLGLHSDNVIYMGSSGCIGVCPYNPATPLGIGSAPWASLAVAGAASVGSIVINNTISLTATAAVLTSSGDIISNGDNGFRASAIGGFYWQGRTFIACPASGQLVLENSLGSIGVGLDFATEALLKVRNRALNNDADLAFRNGFASSSIAFGVNPASAGMVKLPQAGYIYSRNAANTGDIFVIGCGVGGDDVVYVGHPGSGLNLRGTTVNLSGTLLLPNSQYIWARNAADTANVPLLRLNNLNQIDFGPSSAIFGSDLRIPDNFWFYWPTRGALGAIAVDKIALLNVNNTSGVGLDFSTDGTLKIRTRSHGADAAVTCSVLTATSYIAIGANPSVIGEIRLPSSGTIMFRNAGNTADQVGMTGDGTNLILGFQSTVAGYAATASIILRTAGAVTVPNGILAIGTNPANSGPIRLPYNAYITARESTNTADRRLIGFFQNVDLDADASGVSFHGGRSLLICPADGTFELHNRGGNLWATLLAGQIIAKTGSLVVGSSPGIQEFGTNSIALGGATTIACVQSSFDPVTSNLANGMWWVEATGVSPARQLRLAVRDGGVTYYQNIGAAH